MLSRAVFVWLAAASLPAFGVKLGAVHQYGGSEAETVTGMARDSGGNLFVAGTTYSYNFPANVNQLHPGSSDLWRGNIPMFSHRAARVFSLAVDGSRRAILASTSSGLLRSTDLGDTWTGGAQGLPAAQNGGMLAVGADGVAYFALFGSGIFRSLDGGITWSASTNGIGQNRYQGFADQIAVDPRNPANLLATDTISGRMFRSTDEGAKWNALQQAIGYIAFDPSRANVVYGVNSGSLYRSTDDGVTWTALEALFQRADRVTVDAAGVVYCTSSQAGDRIAVSTDGGVSWFTRNVTGAGAIAADLDSGKVYAATAAGVFVSADSFLTSSKISAAPEVSSLAIIPAAAPGAPGVVFSASSDAFAEGYVMKLDPSGNLIWATYLGGSGYDFATAVAVDASGSVYVLGTTSSPDFPVTPGALTETVPGNFLVKLSPAGSVTYSATFGQGGAVTGLAVDSAGNAYTAGTATTFIGTGLLSIPQTRAATCKIDASASQVIYCTNIDGGSARSIAVTPDGTAYLGGTERIWRLSPGVTPVFEWDLPGATVSALALDSDGLLYAAGNTTSPQFPVTAAAYQQQFVPAFYNQIAGALNANSGDHAFVLRISGNDIVNSTLLEGENWEHALAIAVSKSGEVTVGGTTASNSFPLAGAFQTRFAYYTGFVARLTRDLSTLLFSTYAGDTHNFQVSGLAISDDGGVLFAGDTSNQSSFFGSTNELAQTSDIFVAALNQIPPTTPQITGVLSAASQNGTRIAPNQNIVVAVEGVASPDSVVLLDDQPLPLLSTSGGRIVANIPNDRAVTAASTVRVSSGGALSDPLLVQGAAVAPAIYTRDLSGHGEGLVFHEDGSLNSADNPAAPGSIITVACTGVGHVGFDGDYAVADTPVSVYVDGFYANGVDAHMVRIPGIDGDVYAIRVYVPDPKIDGFKMPPFVSLTLNIGGTANASGILSQPGVGISIKQ